MFKYAQLNDKNILVGVSYLSGEVIDDNMILINNLEPVLGSTYNPSSGEFTQPEQQPVPEPPTPVEQIAEETLLETKYQTFLLEMMI